MPQQVKKILPKHKLDGQRAGFGIGHRGEIFINLNVENESTKKSIVARVLIDTGFNGFLQLTDEIVNKLGLNIIKKSKTKLADNRIVEVGVTTSKIKILSLEIKDLPIQIVDEGNFLVGTQLLKSLKSMMIIDYNNNIVSFTNNKRIQKKIYKNFEKYAEKYKK